MTTIEQQDSAPQDANAGDLEPELAEATAHHRAANDEYKKFIREKVEDEWSAERNLERTTLLHAITEASKRKWAAKRNLGRTSLGN